jgi:predicted TIM-barrel fold metal-dependent hydrolase
MQIVDAHHHLWDLEINSYPWLADKDHDRGWGDWSALRKSYRVSDFLKDAAGLDLVASVHVQANFDPANPVGETEWLEAAAEAPASSGFPHAIVAFTDLSAADAEKTMAAQAAHGRVRGIRQVLNRHADPKLNRAPRDYLADPLWHRNFALLERYGLSFDAQVYHRQMEKIALLAEANPRTTIVLDHCGMPAERDEDNMAGWKRGMGRLARCANVFVKLCGFGMFDLGWTARSICPLVREAIDLFGPARCMFGSNFPVDRLMSDYARLWEAYQATVQDFATSERHSLFSGTAARVYRLDLPRQQPAARR